MSETKRPNSYNEEIDGQQPASKRQVQDTSPDGIESAAAPAGPSAKVQDTSPAGSTAEAAGPSANTGQSVDDVSLLIGLKPGDRVEVKWDLHVDVPVTEESSDAKTPVKTKTVTLWWGATLLQPDGRTHCLTDDGGDFSSSPVPTPKKPADAATVPIRVLDYDPNVAYGFHDRSLEEVVFLSDHSLLNLSSNTRAHYRREGTDWEPTAVEQIGEDGLCRVDLGDTLPASAAGGGQTAGAAAVAAAAGLSNDEPVLAVSGEEGVRSVLDSVLLKALGGVSDKMGKLDPAQQRIVAEKIADAKEKLMEKLMEKRDDGSNGGGGANMLITPQLVKRCMEEIGQDM